MSIPSWCRVGAKVVCVKRGPWTLIEKDPAELGPEPKFGMIYTIARVIGDDGGWLTLEELLPTDAFDVNRFRPLVTDSDENGIEAQFYHKRGLKSKAPVRESEHA